MSQMLVRIDKEIDKELTYIYDNDGMLSLNEVAVAMGIVRRIFEQWKPKHEEKAEDNRGRNRCRSKRIKNPLCATSLRLPAHRQ